MMTDATVVVAGAGQAGAQTASSLREEGFAGRIVLVGDEPHLPYQRPPLSRYWLTGAVNRAHRVVAPWTFDASHDIELRLGERVCKIDLGTPQG